MTIHDASAATDQVHSRPAPMLTAPRPPLAGNDVGWFMAVFSHLEAEGEATEVEASVQLIVARAAAAGATAPNRRARVCIRFPVARTLMHAAHQFPGSQGSQGARVPGVQGARGITECTRCTLRTLEPCEPREHCEPREPILRRRRNPLDLVDVPQHMRRGEIGELVERQGAEWQRHAVSHASFGAQ